MHLEKVTHFHVCGGVGSGAAGFNDADPSIGAIRGQMVCVGGVDVDPRACRDFKALTGVEQTCRDLFTLQQYRAFHGHMPPPGWVEFTPADMRTAAHGHFPDIVFTSMPCKGFSGLLSQSKSTTAKYVALNELTERGVWLTFEAFGDDPPGLFIFENVPRIASRGRYLVDRITAIGRHYGYHHAETVHDCGELGDGLAQSRRRFLLVMRHARKVPPFLYEPPKRRLHAVGDVLRHMPLPGDPAGGPMHRVPSLQWQTWVRLAFVEAGSDWRSLKRLEVVDGKLRDFLIVPELRNGVLGVHRWEDSATTVAGRNLPTNGAFSVADPGTRQSPKWNHGQHYGVRSWEQPADAVTGQAWPNQGRFAVADPRGPESDFRAYRVVGWDRSAGVVTGANGAPAGSTQSVADPRHGGPSKHNNEFRIVRWESNSQAVTSAHGTGQAVADPRPDWNRLGNNLVVQDWDKPSRTVIAGGKGVQGGYLSIADPRPNMQRGAGDHYLSGGHYGVVPWTANSGAVSASACHDNGPFSVADPREAGCDQTESNLEKLREPLQTPSQRDKLVCRITSLDGTWHRPFTTLELAALQSLIDPEEWFAPGGPGARGQAFVLDGDSDQRWREGIGNAVPRKSAKAIGTVMGQTILLARTGETFALGSTPIWVQPMVVALSVDQGASHDHHH